MGHPEKHGLQALDSAAGQVDKIRKQREIFGNLLRSVISASFYEKLTVDNREM